MKQTKIFVLLLAMIAAGTTGFVSCQKQQKEVASPVKNNSVAKQDKDEKDDEKLQSKESELKYYERILCLGLLDVSINPTFKNIALNLTQQHHLQDTAVNDYYATFTQLNNACQNAGFNMVNAMKNSVLAHGGTAQDASNLQDIILGFKIRGIDLEPGLRLSYRDGLVPNLDNVHRVTCMQLYNNTDSIPAWSLNPSGVYQEQALSRTTIYQSPSWVVNILRKDRGRSKYLYSVEKIIPCLYRCCRMLAIGCCSDVPGKDCRCLASSSDPCLHYISAL